ncbi:MAG: 5-(carboxyamino)imidazole ribonucleotide mutase [Candidatus Omnitrophica bacterium]|nr:5-(carboxyamino)imidazole ribonucleotide mutase [Candidatus Omnitrophota bacterium]
MGKREVEVSILMGSKSDLEIVQEAIKILESFEISYEVKVLSAHRTPKDLVNYVEQVVNNGVKVIIAAAGMSAALAGTIAAHTVLPVIGIPIETKNLKGLDSLLSTVQMPKGIPVACMSIGMSGAANAGLFACQILALQKKDLGKKLKKFKEDMAKEIRKIRIG